MTTDTLQVARIIQKQINMHSLMCWGAHKFSAVNELCGGLAFKVNPNPKLRGGGTVKVVLNPLDLYDITIYNNRNRTIYHIQNAYAEDMEPILWNQLG